MKRSLLGLATLSLSAATLAKADGPIVANPIVQVPVRAIFVPAGFDDNDETVLVLDGFLPSSCYRLTTNEAKVNEETGEIEVIQYARKFPDPCLAVRVPFASEVRLGVLPSRDFTVRAQGTDPAPLAVKRATLASADDYFYAPVDAASVDFDSEAGAYVATLTGRLTSSCLAWDDIKVEDQGTVYLVLPIIKKLDNGAACTEEEISFTKKVVLPGRPSQGRHLLHVRSLNGKAVNTMFSVGRL